MDEAKKKDGGQEEGIVLCIPSTIYISCQAKYMRPPALSLPDYPYFDLPRSPVSDALIHRFTVDQESELVPGIS